MWVAKNEQDGMVVLFQQKPLLEGVEGRKYFIDRHTFEEGFLLGKRPKLGFKLPYNTCKKVDVTFKEID